MESQYTLSELRLLSVREDLDTTQAVYDLPAPIPWFIKRHVGGEYWEESLHMVSRARIYLTTDEFTNEPYAGAVPYDDKGREHPISSVHYLGACSVTAVLNRMGYKLSLPNN